MGSDSGPALLYFCDAAAEITREVFGTHAEAAPKQVSRRNRGGAAPAGRELASCGTRFVADELNATKRPSGLMAGDELGPLASSPSGPRERRMVAGTQVDAEPMQVSRRKMSLQPLLSPFTKLLASEANTTNRPSALTEGALLGPLGSAPFHPTETGKICGRAIGGGAEAGVAQEYSGDAASGFDRTRRRNLPPRLDSGGPDWISAESRARRAWQRPSPRSRRRSRPKDNPRSRFRTQ